MIISMLLPLLVIALVAGLGLLVISLELKNAYKQGYHESNLTIDEEDVKQK